MSAAHTSSDTEVPSHRACTHCRSQKVRCMVDDANPNVCQRCARTGRSCVFTPLQRRKQRKRTDTRVAELEREMQVMQSMLKNKSREQDPKRGDATSDVVMGRPTKTSTSENASDAQIIATGSAPYRADHHSVQAGLHHASISGSRSALAASQLPNDGAKGKDVIDRDIISMATARHLFETYRNELFLQFPIVPIRKSTSADDMRQSNPTLFLAIIAAAASKDHPDISATLDKEVLHAYAAKTLVHSQKSLEMVQALLISAVWYHPPNRFSQLKYYEYIHMAATMAINIGIATRSVPHRSRFQANSRAAAEDEPRSVHPLEDAANPDLSMTPRPVSSSDTSSIESRRTFVSCYSLCTSVSMSLRRPNMLRVSSYVKECVDYLASSPNALPEDRTLVAWARLMMITEEITNAFSYDDPGGIASIVELRSQLMLKDFAKRLDDWFKDASEGGMASALAIMYWNTRLYLHEIGLHVDHSPGDFSAPYQMGAIYPWDSEEEIPTQILSETVAECVSCSHNLINTFLAMDVESLRALPVLTYVRVSYAAFVLTKLCLSANFPGSKIGSILDRTSLKVDSLLDRAILHMQAVLGPTRSRVPSIFLALLFKLRQWCLNPERIGRPQFSVLDMGMQNPVDEKQEPAHSRPNMFIEGPRVTDHSSTDESSPQDLLEDQARTNEWMDQLPADSVGESGMMWKSDCIPGPADVESSNIDSIPSAPAAGFTGENGDAQVSSFLNPDAQMELDETFFQFFGGMNEDPETSLPGLTDWATLSTDLFGLSDSLELGNTTSGDERTPLRTF